MGCAVERCVEATLACACTCRQAEGDHPSAHETTKRTTVCDGIMYSHFHSDKQKREGKGACCADYMFGAVRCFARYDRRARTCMFMRAYEQGMVAPKAAHEIRHSGRGRGGKSNLFYINAGLKRRRMKCIQHSSCRLSVSAWCADWHCRPQPAHSQQHDEHMVHLVERSVEGSSAMQHQMRRCSNTLSSVRNILSRLAQNGYNIEVKDSPSFLPSLPPVPSAEVSCGGALVD